MKNQNALTTEIKYSLLILRRILRNFNIHNIDINKYDLGKMHGSYSSLLIVLCLGWTHPQWTGGHIASNSELAHWTISYHFYGL